VYALFCFELLSLSFTVVGWHIFQIFAELFFRKEACVAAFRFHKGSVQIWEIIRPVERGKLQSQSLKPVEE
jgi:NADH:ubiquinone oxidoreductase subunit F (NADH-binding)